MRVESFISMKKVRSSLNFVFYFNEHYTVFTVNDIDMHNILDLKNPKSNKNKTPGFCDAEREGMTELLKSGFIDTFRHFYPEQKDAYSFWTYMMNARAKNVGW